jgi:hypothetical protein
VSEGGCAVLRVEGIRGRTVCSKQLALMNVMKVYTKDNAGLVDVEFCPGLL